MRIFNLLSLGTKVLFEGDEEGASLGTLILDSLQHCAVDTRCVLAQNILLVGGKGHPDIWSY